MTNGQSAGKPLKGGSNMDVIAVNAKLGDGCLNIPPNCINARALFNGKNVQWISFKRDLAIKKGYRVSQLKQAYSGYKDSMSLVQFSTSVDKRLTEAFFADRYEFLKNLSNFDLILWYIDDGSWHRSRKTMHLYCNMLNESEMQELIDRIGFLYGICPTPRQDRKKDGRSYPYLYFPRLLVEKFRKDVFHFLKVHELDSLYYKVGETSETIREE